MANRLILAGDDGQDGRIHQLVYLAHVRGGDLVGTDEGLIGLLDDAETDDDMGPWYIFIGSRGHIVQVSPGTRKIVVPRPVDYPKSALADEVMSWPEKIEASLMLREFPSGWSMFCAWVPEARLWAVDLTTVRQHHI